MHKIISARVVDKYKIDIIFDTNESFVYDAEPDLWGEVFEPLKDPAFFSRLSVDDFGAISWPNGADYCTDSLYMKMEESRTLHSAAGR
jgi:hypothetical protein